MHRSRLNLAAAADDGNSQQAPCAYGGGSSSRHKQQQPTRLAPQGSVVRNGESWCLSRRARLVLSVVTICSLLPVLWRDRSSGARYRGLRHPPSLLSLMRPATVFTPRTPEVRVVWSHGWYNAVAPPPTVPLRYYRDGHMSEEIRRILTVGTNYTGSCGVLWLRTEDVPWWASDVVPHLQCDVILISSEGDQDVPHFLYKQHFEPIQRSSRVKAWYAQNVDGAVTSIGGTPLIGIPIGLSLHDGYQEWDERHHIRSNYTSLETLQRMTATKAAALPYVDRQRTILYDKGSFGRQWEGPVGGKKGRRWQHRTVAFKQLTKKSGCERVKLMQPTNRTNCWAQYAAHQFAIAPMGNGWDTHRMWELLFLGTVPIVLSGPMDAMLHDAHLPVVIVRRWSDVCAITNHQYDEYARRYEAWIGNALQWLEPTLWIPRDQYRLDQLCHKSDGCSQGIATTHTTLDTIADIGVASFKWFGRATIAVMGALCHELPNLCK